MATITLTNPTAGSAITAALHATNYSAIQTAINGGLDATNFASGLIFDPSKLAQNAAVRGQALIWNGSAWAPTGSTVLFADSLLGADAASIDIQNIPQTAKHLLIAVYGRSTRAANNTDTASLRFNNDAAGNYDYHLQAFGGNIAPPADTSLGATTAIQWGELPAATATTSFSGGGFIFIPAYKETTLFKMAIALTAKKMSTTALEGAANLGFAWWRSTVAISRVTLFAGNGNLLAGSHVSLYGLS